MKTRMVRALILVAVLFGLLFLGAPTRLAQAKGVSPEGFLNPDGTLNLDGTFNGTLDLNGYGVQLDAERGPVFAPSANSSNTPASVATLGNWAAIGDGGGNIGGSVFAIAVIGTNIYVGGDFSDTANMAEADYVAKWDTLSGNWSALNGDGAGNGSLNGSVEALAVSGTELYVGGTFTNLNNSGSVLNAADYVAKWDGANWSALGSNGSGNGALGNAVRAIAVSGSSVYVGGSFTNVNNGGAVLNAADYIAKWDTAMSAWSALSSNGAGEGAIGNNVYALAASGSSLFVGGTFTDVNNGGNVLNAADYVAKWDTLSGNWSALGSNGSGNGAVVGAVYALAVSGTDLYVGGQFQNASNGSTVLATADYIAKWDTLSDTWSALGSNGSGNGALGNTVRAIVVSGSSVYVGGYFTNAANVPEADYIGKWDTLSGNWAALGSNGAGGGVIPGKGSPVVRAIAMQGGNVFVGGLFYDLNNDGSLLPQADAIAQWNGSDWSSLGTTPNGALANAGYYVSAIALMGSNVYVGGYFKDVSNHGVNIPEADYIAKWDTLSGNWSALGSNGWGDGSLSFIVYALAVSGTDLYVGGQFTNVNNSGPGLNTADYIVKWNGTSWSALGSNGAGDGALNGTVEAIAVSGSNVYVGGYFTNAANIPEADYVAKWDTLAGNWSAMGSNGTGNGALGNYVNALAVSDSNIYAGGEFVNVANIPEADYVAKWNGTDWSALGSNGAGNGSLNFRVNTLAANGTDLFVGGGFINVNNNGTTLPAADMIAKWNTLSGNWSALGSNGTGNGALGNSVQAIAVSGSNVYVGGYFTNAANIPEADYVAQWDALSGNWSALSSNGAGNGSLNKDITALAVSGPDLLVGGRFTNVNNNGTVLEEADLFAAYGIAAPKLYLPLITR